MIIFSKHLEQNVIHVIISYLLLFIVIIKQNIIYYLFNIPFYQN